ncbi:hypothetical protein ACFQU2_01515 [Siccirubricoccus deserti]
MPAAPVRMGLSWRAMLAGDLPAVAALAEALHPEHPDPRRSSPNAWPWRLPAAGCWHVATRCSAMR